MDTYVIERGIDGIGGASADDLQAISQKSASVLAGMGPDIQWLHSYVTGDKIYCVYRATSEDLVREHARLGGFPADSVFVVAAAEGQFEMAAATVVDARIRCTRVPDGR